MKPIKHKRHSILSLAITALLTVGVVSYVEIGYATSSNNEGGDHNEGGDNNARGNDNEDKKITICHVPPGNPENKHTIHIGYSAWPAHRDNHVGDYLGSCTQAPASSTTVDEVRVITGCTGTYRETLITKVQSYFEPIVVSDDALTDDRDSEDVVTALSQCLDAGDSSDSSDSSDKKKDNRGNGKGSGHDSVSDSGKHHFISGCKSKANDSNDSNDSNAYRNKLKKEDSGYKKAKAKTDSNLIVSDSSLDDSGVREKYKACVADSDDASKIDSSKVKLGQGDSGHQYRIVKGCGDSGIKDLKEELTKHKERVEDANDAKYKDRPIVITTVSMQDAAIEAARAECLDPAKGGGTEKILTDTTPPGGTTPDGTHPDDTTPGGGGDTTPPADTTPGNGGDTTPPAGTTPGDGGDTTPPAGTGTTPNTLPNTGKSGRLNWREITNPDK